MARRSLALVVVMALAAAACSSGEAATSTTTASSAVPSTAATTIGTTPTTAAVTTTTTEAGSSTTVDPTPGSGNPFEIVRAELRDYESVDPPLTVLIGVPRLQGMTNTALQQVVNDSLLGIVTGAEEAFIADVARYVEDVEPTPGVPVSSINMGYDVRLLNSELLSIRFENSTYFEGAARPGQGVQTFNVDLTTGAEVHLPDLFVGSEWAFALDFLLRDRITEEVYEGDPAGLDGWVDTDAVVISQVFTFGPSGLEFSFQEFEIGPGVLGAPTVTLPFDAMGVYIDPDGVLGGLADITADG